MVETVSIEGVLYSLIVRRDFKKPGIHFFTDDSQAQQLAYMQHPKGKVIKAHVHNAAPRQVDYSMEVLIIKSGKLRVDYYRADQTYLESRVLNAGDIVLLANGGHGFEVLEDLEMIEVKQGPYMGEIDKTRFEGIQASQVRYPGRRDDGGEVPFPLERPAPAEPPLELR